MKNDAILFFSPDEISFCQVDVPEPGKVTGVPLALVGSPASMNKIFTLSIPRILLSLSSPACVGTMLIYRATLMVSIPPALNRASAIKTTKEGEADSLCYPSFRSFSKL